MGCEGSSPSGRTKEHNDDLDHMHGERPSTGRRLIHPVGGARLMSGCGLGVRLLGGLRLDTMNPPARVRTLMRGKADPKLKAECLRLRLDGRRSLKEIHAATGAPMGSISAWLREHPLTPEERRAKEDAGRIRASESHVRKPRGEESHLYRRAPKPIGAVRKSRIAEAAVLFRLALFDIRAFKPMFDGDKADWLAIPAGGGPLKLQVRATKQGPHGLPIVGLRCSSGRKGSRPFQDGEVDFVVGYDLPTDRAYVWSWGEVHKLGTAVSITVEAEERWDKITGVSLSGRAPS
jgi:hypothetical protein